jgi:ATPase subunit of ABC transporter with duplicated ATPase domains
MQLVFQKVTFAYEGASSPLFDEVSAHFPSGWTGIVGANGAGKTTLLQLAAGQLHPQQGTIKRPAQIVLCPQRTDYPPDQLSQLIKTSDAEALALRGQLQIMEDWADRWKTLSHGECKRAQIAVALWLQPDALLIDEPTNHIDSSARELLAKALLGYRGIGLLVSHDRELLDLLCRRCVFVEPPQVVMRSGNYTRATDDANREEASLLAKRRVLKQELERLTRESRRRHAESAGADRKRSKRHLARGDNDGRAKINGAIVSGKDGQAGRLASQLEGRLAQAQEKVVALKVQKRYAANFWLDTSASPRQRIFSMPPTTLNMGETRRLIVPGLTIHRHDRIAITGANGLGKTTFIRHVLGRLNIPEERLIYMPQEIELAQTRNIIKEVHRLSHEQLGHVMTVVSGLGSRPERLLHNLDASPGELRKVLLALGVIRRPYLIVMDEPTNHLDLPAIKCLEDALRDCPCGMLLASHDMHFLSRIAYTRWHLERESETVTMHLNAEFRPETSES